MRSCIPDQFLGRASLLERGLRVRPHVITQLSERRCLPRNRRLDSGFLNTQGIVSAWPQLDNKVEVKSRFHIAPNVAPGRGRRYRNLARIFDVKTDAVRQITVPSVATPPGFAVSTFPILAPVPSHYTVCATICLAARRGNRTDTTRSQVSPITERDTRRDGRSCIHVGRRNAEMTIVRATPSHVRSLVPLFMQYLSFYRRDANASSVELFLGERLRGEDAVVNLALDDSLEPVGFVQLYPSWSSLALKRLWILNDLFVVPRARRQGVARRLIESCVQLARETGAKGMVLETAVDNVPARALYETLGWKLEREFDRYTLDL